MKPTQPLPIYRDTERSFLGVKAAGHEDHSPLSDVEVIIRGAIPSLRNKCSWRGSVFTEKHLNVSRIYDSHIFVRIFVFNYKNIDLTDSVNGKAVPVFQHHAM
jgi:hypothetical protein